MIQHLGHVALENFRDYSRMYRSIHQRALYDRGDTLKSNEFARLEGSLDPSHLIFEINVGERRTRHRTTLNLNDVIFFSNRSRN